MSKPEDELLDAAVVLAQFVAEQWDELSGAPVQESSPRFAKAIRTVMQARDARDVAQRVVIHQQPKCTRWGTEHDRCVRAYGHTGPCEDAQGNTTLTLVHALLTKS